MRIYAAPGLKIRDPFKKDLLPAEGREVDDNDTYWNRLLADGDVVNQQPAAEPVKPRGSQGSTDE